MTQHTDKELIVIDNVEPCPYLPNQQARMPLRVVLGKMTPLLTDAYLSAGYRRSGEFVYRTQCPSCQACEPIRVSPAEFRPGRGGVRTLRRGDRRYVERIGPMQADEQRVQLFNRHRQARGLASNERDIDLDDYHWGFVRSCFSSFEIAWYDGPRLVAVAICDRGQQSVSAVYTFYDPDIRGDSLGTYAILKQLEFCRQNRIDWLYLGYYVSECGHMNYKKRFLPHERLLDGKWQKFV